MRFQSRVATKLVGLIVGGLLLCFGVATWYNLRVQEHATTHILTLNGVQLADLVAGATREAMLHNDREAIRGTIDTLGHQRDIAKIRVLNKTGLISYSATPGEVGQKLEATSNQCQLCHSKTPPPEALTASQMVRRVNREGGPVLEITRVILNEPDCSSAPCHVHPPSQRLLGFMDVHIDLDPFDQARRSGAVLLVASSVAGILLVSILTFAAVRAMVRRPVRQMIRGAEALAHGDHSVRVPELTNDELGQLARTFNRMARDLEKAHSELLEWAQTLEHRVEDKSQELARAQDQIIRVERLASLGRLAAVVAHEINNPLSSVVTYAKIVIRRLQGQEQTSEECRENLTFLRNISSEAARCGEIVSQLLAFARHRGGEFAPVNVNAVVEKSILLVNHKLEMASVKANTDLAEDLVPVRADAGQVQQALMALLINSCEAMEKGGEVTVRTRNEAGGILVEMSDTGPGMAPEVAAHVFEPFFTTKTAGAGVGLGLAVVYGIVRRHGGRISLQTSPGQGCAFTLYFPADPPESGQEEMP